MSLIKQVFKKDFYQQRMFILYWILAVIIEHVFFGVLSEPHFGLIGKIAAYPLMFFLKMVSLYLMVSIVSALTMEESPVDPSAYWLSRPMRVRDLLVGKLCFCLLFLVFVPALVRLISLLVQQFSIGIIIAELLGQMLFNIALFVFVFARAVHVKGPLRKKDVVSKTYGIVLWVCFAAYLYSRYGVLDRRIEYDSCYITSLLVGIVLWSIAIVLRYQSRKRYASAPLWWFSLVLFLFIWNVKPVKLYKLNQSGNNLSNVCLSIDKVRAPFWEDDEGVEDASDVCINGYFLADGLPDGCFAKLNEIDATVSVDGREMDSWDSHSFEEHYFHAQALMDLLDPLDLIIRRHRTFFEAPLFEMDRADFIENEGRAVHYEADARFSICKYAIKSSLPVEVGKVFKTDRAAIRIASVLHKVEGCKLVIQEKKINPLFKRDLFPIPEGKFVYILANRKTGEAYIHDRERGVDIGVRYGAVTTHNRRLIFDSENKIGSRIDAEWLKNAELLIVEMEWLGEIDRQIEDHEFTLGKHKRTQVIPESTASLFKDQLDAIELPDCASRQQVLEYILLLIVFRISRM